MLVRDRYYYNGNFQEIFWTLLRLVDSLAAGLKQCILNEFDKLISNSPSKLVQQLQHRTLHRKIEYLIEKGMITLTSVSLNILSLYP